MGEQRDMFEAPLMVDFAIRDQPAAGVAKFAIPAQPPAATPSKKRTASQNGRRSRAKGKTWEREVAKLLRPVFGEHVKRGFQSRSGRDGADVEGSPFWVEAKHGRLVNVRAALAQALKATDGRPPLVVAKDDRSEPFVVMQLHDFLRILAKP